MFVCAEALFSGPRGHVLGRLAMELLVFVRNHGGRDAGNTYVGASVGEAPHVEALDHRAPLTSTAEFRVDASVEDPVQELRDAVEQVFAMIGPRPHGRPTYVTRPQSAIRVLLEPGFDRPGEVAGDLAEMLAMCSPKVEARSQLARPSQESAYA